jgi:DNA-binding beta-propeller fold protein YncE
MIAENVSYTINYDLVDINDDRVSVAFFYDADNADFDGSAIKGNCTAAAAGIGLACTWDTRGVPPGTYYVYGIADDTFNPPVAVYSQGKITINATPSLTLHQPSSLGKHVTMGLPFTIRYDLVDPDDTITAAFYYDKDNSDVNGIPISGACETAAEGNNVTCLWDTSDVLPSTYYIYGLVSDGINPPVAAYSSGPVTIDTRYQKSRQPNGMEPVKVKKIFTTDIYGRNLVYPNEIHYDPFMDEIYLMSSGPNPATRITIYGSDYFPVAALGRGRGVTNPMGLTVDSEGNIYIAINIEFDDESGQTVDQRVMVLNAAFFKVRDILFNQENIPNWDSAFIPAHMALSNDETKLYISGANSNAALVIDTEGNFVRWLVPMRTKGGVETMGDNPQHPESLKVQDVVVDENGRIYLLCDEVGRIFVLDHNGQLLFAFGEQGGSTGKLSNPRALAVDVDREAIYVVDYMRHAINIYNYEDGEFIFEFGGQGRGSGWFAYPNHIDVDQRGNVLVVDMFNHRAQVMEVP